MEQSGFLVIEKQQNIDERWGCTVVSLLAAVGVLGGILSTFVETISWVYVLLVLLVMVVLTFASGKVASVLYGGLGVALLCYLTVFGTVFRSGVLQFANNVIALYNYLTGNEVYYYVVEQEGSKASFALFVYTMTALFYMLLYDLLKRKRITAFVVLNVLVILLVLLFKNERAAIFCICSLLAIPLAIMLDKVQQSKKMLVLSAGMFVIGLLVSGIYMVSGSYQSNLTAAKMKASVVKQAESVRYGKQDAPQGDLALAASYAGDKERRLMVKASKADVFYLKGFVGGSYHSNIWEDIELSHYAGDYEGMFAWMKKKNFHPFSQNSAFLRLAAMPSWFSETEITVSNIGANEKYFYTPYGLHIEDVQSLNGVNKDMNVYASDNSKTATFMVDYYDTATAFSLENPIWMNSHTAVEEYVDFRDAQVEYRSFVYDSYLDMEPEYKAYFEKVLPNEKLSGYAAVTTYIRKWLENTEHLNKKQKTTDYLVYFMDHTRQGNSCFYASAATLLYRYYGIPSRYVEGYIADLRDVDEKDGMYEKALTGVDVHAWVEIYKDGIGWIPVEVTPGFYSDLELKQQTVIEQQQQQNEEEEEERDKKKEIRYKNVTKEIVIILMLMIVGILVGILVRRAIICWIRKERLDAKCEVKLKTVIRFMRQLLLFGEMTEESLREDVIMILRKYRFFEKGISDEDCEILKQYALGLQKNLFENQNRKRKLLMKYIWALI